MKKSGYKSIFYMYIGMLLLSLVILLTGVFLLFGLIHVSDGSGDRVLSNWPQRYTENFTEYIETDNELPSITAAGKQSLDENHSWIQIIDEGGNVVYSYGAAGTRPTHYSPSEFLELYQGLETEEDAIFAGTTEETGDEYSYVIGFPLKIAKVTMYLNGDKFTGGKSLILILLTIGALLIILSGGILGVWVSKHLRKIIQSVDLITYRLYEPVQHKGVFQDIYDSLNSMDEQLHKSDAELARTEKMQEEWLANITHDLKTPLSPIKGYAELLADPDATISDETRSDYGGIILRNALFTESLVEDLKLTYQLKNNMLPLNKKSANLSRFLKETVIEIVNNPDYAGRNISFSDTIPENIETSFDQKLLKRAINNVICNALIHNSEDTSIAINLELDERIHIIIEDNGEGMDESELASLFQRYYRGTSSAVKTEGTGLGMAIVKQIVEVHEGTIEVISKKGKGTKISLSFPR